MVFLSVAHLKNCPILRINHLQVVVDSRLALDAPAPVALTSAPILPCTLSVLIVLGGDPHDWREHIEVNSTWINLVSTVLQVWWLL